MTKITGNDLISWGLTPSAWFKDAIVRANELRQEGVYDECIVHELRELEPKKMYLRNYTPRMASFLSARTNDEVANDTVVREHMFEVMRVPTITAGALLPDACPQGGAPGTIPVGAVVACEDAIHPGFHSSDVCCSVAMTTLRQRGLDPRRVLDTLERVTEFGPGNRRKPMLDVLPPPELDFENPFLYGLEWPAIHHYATQGDGNHFAYVGTLKSTGQVAIVTHHGSRGFGAQVYKRGMTEAQKHTRRVADGVPKHNAWLQASSDLGRAYWRALQEVRRWTRANHFVLHEATLREVGSGAADRVFSEHNFVFRKSDGRYYHAKGATPSWRGFSEDDDGRALIPLNMAEPVLIVRHGARTEALDFAPHGAGRNLGRRELLRRMTPELPAHIDARFTGTPDPSEFPGAYKSAASVRAQIADFRLAEVIDEVEPYGCIMAGRRKESP